ncbi:MAG: Hsp20/alpha crystallin family protein [Kiloniellales bacterium]|nr:Hsp20/alpha crystallin family protein [Kiloniellales bacterium]
MARLFPDPFETLFNLQRSLDAFRASDWLARGPSGRGGYPPLNVFRQGDDFVILTELPGIRREDVDIRVHGDRIRIAGRKSIDYGEGVSLHRRERISGAFDRTVAIPVEVDADRVKAEYRDGVLALFLPRAERDKPKSITVR